MSYSSIEKTARRLAEICSFATVCMAGLALLSWGLGHEQLGAFGGGYVPMAPSMALAMLPVVSFLSTGRALLAGASARVGLLWRPQRVASLRASDFGFLSAFGFSPSHWKQPNTYESHPHRG